MSLFSRKKLSDSSNNQVEINKQRYIRLLIKLVTELNNHLEGLYVFLESSKTEIEKYSKEFSHYNSQINENLNQINRIISLVNKLNKKDYGDYKVQLDRIFEGLLDGAKLIRFVRDYKNYEAQINAIINLLHEENILENLKSLDKSII